MPLYLLLKNSIFTRAMDLIPDGNVYLNGELYNNVLDEKSKMGYNPETHQ